MMCIHLYYGTQKKQNTNFTDTILPQRETGLMKRDGFCLWKTTDCFPSARGVRRK